MTLDEAIKDMETIAEENQRVVDTKDVTIDMLFCDDEEIEERLEKYQKSAENYRQLAEWLKELKQLREKVPCEDAISRQAVLDLVNSDWKYEGLETDVASLPPVNPQPKTGHWIPASERLPEDGRPVLIYAWNVHHVIARYDSFRTENGYKKCWVTADAWNGNTEIRQEVIAWMPLPEPYTAEGSEE